MLNIYRRIWQVNWAEQWQYRANLLMYLLYWLVSPVVYLAVWTSVANRQGAVSGLTANDFVTYYMTLLIVDNLTSQITIHILAYKIHGGTLSTDLLMPVHPILTSTLLGNLAFKLLSFIALVPIWIALYWLFQPDFSTVTPLTLLLAVPALAIGFCINFFLGTTITCVAFWTTRVYALNEFYTALVLLFSGLFVPLDLLPPALQPIAEFLPFRLLIYFPIELILGRLAPQVILREFALGGIWCVLGIGLFLLVWQRGLRRFSSVGG
jgi:ABC-2 type transport system permease protein